jgi:hypothetical protein
MNYQRHPPKLCPPDCTEHHACCQKLIQKLAKDKERMAAKLRKEQKAVACLKKQNDGNPETTIGNDADAKGGSEGSIAPSSQCIKKCLKKSEAKKQSRHGSAAEGSVEASAGGKTPDGGVAKTNDNNGNSNELNPADNTPGQEWTASQDAIILAMKEGGETWSVIGNALGRGKDEARLHWKEITNTGDSQVSGKTDKRERSIKGHRTVYSVSSDSEVDSEAWSPQRELANLKRREEAALAMMSRAYDQPGESDAEDESFSTLDARVLAMLRLKRKDEKWLEIQAGFFNATGRMVDVELLKQKMDTLAEPDVEPEDGFSALDSEVLSMLWRKQKAEKWLAIQADFFNATGRMVDVELLRHMAEESEEISSCED